MNKGIPKRFFLFWSGQNFQLIHLLCVLSLRKIEPEFQIHIYFRDEPERNTHWNRLKMCESIRFHRLDFNTLFKESRLNAACPEGFLSSAGVNYLSDLFRMLSLYCYGGIYIDFDCLAVRSLKPLTRYSFFAALQPSPHGDVVNGAVMGSSPQHPFLRSLIHKALKLIHAGRVDFWGSLGPILLSDQLRTRHVFHKIRLTLQQRLSSPERKTLRLTTDACFNLIQKLFNPHCFIASETCFYHFSHQEWQRIFEKTELPDKTRIIHLWNYHSRKLTELINMDYLLTSDSLYARKVREILGADFLGNRPGISEKTNTAKMPVVTV